MTVKYHIETPDGVVTRTTKGITTPRYSHVVVYHGNATGVPGAGPGNHPTFHSRYALAAQAADSRGGVVYPIEEKDYSITGKGA